MAAAGELKCKFLLDTSLKAFIEGFKVEVVVRDTVRAIRACIFSSSRWSRRKKGREKSKQKRKERKKRKRVGVYPSRTQRASFFTLRRCSPPHYVWFFHSLPIENFFQTQTPDPSHILDSTPPVPSIPSLTDKNTSHKERVRCSQKKDLIWGCDGGKVCKRPADAHIEVGVWKLFPGKTGILTRNIRLSPFCAQKKGKEHQWVPTPH
jgi:hypothetical protein